MHFLRFILAPLLAATASTRGQEAPLLPVPTPIALRIERFRLFPETVARRIVVGPTHVETRPFHEAGDPDSLFTFGKATPDGELRLKAAFEVNDVVLRAIAPDLRVDPGDTRPRAAGDYRALDARGRPYQLRLGARLVW